MVALMLAAAVAAHAINPNGTIAVAHSCPLQVTKAILDAGKGFDRDSLYVNFFIANPTDKEFLYTYKLQLHSRTKRTDVREELGSNAVLAHSKGWYREFVGVEFAPPSDYTLDQTQLSCVSTGS